MFLDGAKDSVSSLDRRTRVPLCHFMTICWQLHRCRPSDPATTLAFAPKADMRMRRASISRLDDVPRRCAGTGSSIPLLQVPEKARMIPEQEVWRWLTTRERQT
jgi:hypothetical protein